MGNFYANVTVSGGSQNEIAGFLGNNGFSAYISPTVNNFTTIYEEQSDFQIIPILNQLAQTLSEEFRCAALAVMNHDDDILTYSLFQNGELVDEYISSPSYFEADFESDLPKGGNAELLCKIFSSEKKNEVNKILNDLEEYTFELDRHKDLFNALNLPQMSVSFGFNYIQNNQEFPLGINKEDFIKV